MPRAECSLADFLEGPGLNRHELVIAVLKNMLQCLDKLDGEVVHRDIKPANILQLDGEWHLADFGISRQAGAETATDTKKDVLSPKYASPEQFAGDRATAASDIYSLGVVAFEIATGQLPFPGPNREDFKEQHLNEDPVLDSIAPISLASLIGECLFKPAGTRPSAKNCLARLDRLGQQPAIPAIPELEAANLNEVERQARANSLALRRATAAEQRNQMIGTAKHLFELVVDEALTGIRTIASQATLERGKSSTIVTLGKAKLAINGPRGAGYGSWTEEAAFNVVAAADIRVEFLRDDPVDLDGRSHSLWYCDAQTEGEFAWFETSFHKRFEDDPLPFDSPAFGCPFAIDPSPDAAGALGQESSRYEVAWPFTPLIPGSLSDFIFRWGTWLARANSRSFQRPSKIPEHDPTGSWRTQ